LMGRGVRRSPTLRPGSVARSTGMGCSVRTTSGPVQEGRGNEEAPARTVLDPHPVRCGTPVGQARGGSAEWARAQLGQRGGGIAPESASDLPTTRDVDQLRRAVLGRLRAVDLFETLQLESTAAAGDVEPLALRGDDEATRPNRLRADRAGRLRCHRGPPSPAHVEAGRDPRRDDVEGLRPGEAFVKTAATRAEEKVTFYRTLTAPTQDVPQLGKPTIQERLVPKDEPAPAAAVEAVPEQSRIAPAARPAMVARSRPQGGWEDARCSVPRGAMYFSNGRCGGDTPRATEPAPGSPDHVPDLRRR
jgi:hypothetical protein